MAFGADRGTVPLVERHESVFYRRALPHIIRFDRPLFLTWSTLGFWRLPPGARKVALRHAMHEHCRSIFVYVAVVMPDHVHMIFRLIRPGADLATIMKRIKGVSARRINQLLRRTGTVWLDESLDHVVRNAEWSQRKIEYTCNTPVRAGLVASPDQCPWLWRSWVEGGDRGFLNRFD